MKHTLNFISKSEPLRALFFIVYVFWLGGISLGGTVFLIDSCTDWWQYVLLFIYHIPLLWIKSISEFASKLNLNS